MDRKVPGRKDGSLDEGAPRDVNEKDEDPYEKEGLSVFRRKERAQVQKPIQSRPVSPEGTGGGSLSGTG